MTTEKSHAEAQAIAQLSSIRDMLAALECDFDRLEELRDERDSLDEEEVRNWPESGELAELEEAAGDCQDQDEARQRIQEDPLSIQVRSGWNNVGEEFEAEEFEILLCTGGPTVRILGELDQNNEPSRAYMQYQDWGTSWTDYYEDGIGAACLAYAQQFNYGG
jgi:hypothetical protein